MRYLVDTNIISELRKGPRCEKAVMDWYQAELVPHGGAISVITLGEIRKGISLLAARDLAQASRLEVWLEGLTKHFDNRILPVTAEIADRWGRLNALRPLPAMDSLLAATAIVHGLVLATRNVSDLENIGATLIDPFQFKS